MNPDLSNIASLLNRQHGSDISRYDVSFLIRSIEKRLTETCCSSIHEYSRFLELNDTEGERFLDSLRIGHSSCFRNTLTFAVLEHVVLPGLLLKKSTDRRKELRIWSAACAAGEESYSLAILLEELKNGGNPYRIFATDISESRIRQALRGEYPEAALDNLTLARVRKWFTRGGDIYSVRPELKDHVEFSAFDLLNQQFSFPPGSIFGDFDLVVCANMLFYYSSDVQDLLLGKMVNSLAAGGYLVTGEVERDLCISHNFQEVFPQSAIFRA